MVGGAAVGTDEVPEPHRHSHRALGGRTGWCPCPAGFSITRGH